VKINRVGVVEAKPLNMPPTAIKMAPVPTILRTDHLSAIIPLGIDKTIYIKGERAIRRPASACDKFSVDIRSPVIGIGAATIKFAAMDRSHIVASKYQL
jgi:hypothetical protein